MNKVVNLQNERKGLVGKIKGLIPKMKEFMKRRENASDVKQCLENLSALCDKAATTHSELSPLLPEEELIKKKE